MNIATLKERRDLVQNSAGARLYLQLGVEAARYQKLTRNRYRENKQAYFGTEQCQL